MHPTSPAARAVPPARVMSASVAVLAVLLTMAACTVSTSRQVSVQINDGGVSAFGFRSVSPDAIDEPAPSSEEPAPAVDTATALIDQIRTLPPIIPGEFPRARVVNRPIGFRAPTISVDDSIVVDVGVDDDGYLDVPGASEVGWYKFGPTPGDQGSAVLAAHIAYNGRDGVFRNIPDLAVGDEFFVDYEDGESQAFEVLGIVQYDKNSLPIEDLFERTGRPRLVLITCGGDFNSQVRSYSDNIIAYAVPIEQPSEE